MFDVQIGVVYDDTMYDFLTLTNENEYFVPANYADYTNELLNSPGIDVIALLGGADGVSDDSGSRIYFGNAGEDKMRGGAGNDTLLGGADNDLLVGESDNDVLAGNNGSDNLIGDSGNDLLLGGQGNDKLQGGIGDDTLSGDRGFDTLTGGDGKDVFILSKTGESIVDDFQNDEDKLQVPLDFNFAEAYFTQVGDNVDFYYQGTRLAVLQNRSVDLIDPSDFLGTIPGANSIRKFGGSQSSGSATDIGSISNSEQSSSSAPVPQLILNDNLEYEYYPVYGDTIEDLVNSMKLNGPIDTNEDERYQGLTDWNYSWDYSFDNLGNLLAVTLDFDTVITLPKWEPDNNTPSDILAEWNRRITDLEEHEKIHYDLAKIGAERVLDSLGEYVNSKPVDWNSANQAAYDITTQFNALSIKYDEITDHGINQDLWNSSLIPTA